jgi:hypothetical protein
MAVTVPVKGCRLPAHCGGGLTTEEAEDLEQRELPTPPRHADEEEVHEGGRAEDRELQCKMEREVPRLAELHKVRTAPPTSVTSSASASHDAHRRRRFAVNACQMAATLPEHSVS